MSFTLFWVIPVFINPPNFLKNDDDDPNPFEEMIDAAAGFNRPAGFLGTAWDYRNAIDEDPVFSYGHIFCPE